MLLTKFVDVKIVSSNYEYFKNLGYEVDKLKQKLVDVKTIKVDVNHLKPKSNAYVTCKCDKCGVEYQQRFSRNKDVCYPCRKSDGLKGNTYGYSLKGIPNLKLCGKNHPRWNPNKSEKRKYVYKCNLVTKQFDLSSLPNSDKPRGLCGVKGAYQLDHIIPLQYGFDNNISPEIMGHIDNLRFVTWEENNSKRDKYIGE